MRTSNSPVLENVWDITQIRGNDQVIKLYKSDWTIHIWIILFWTREIEKIAPRGKLKWTE